MEDSADDFECNYHLTSGPLCWRDVAIAQQFTPRQSHIPVYLCCIRSHTFVEICPFLDDRGRMDQ